MAEPVGQFAVIEPASGEIEYKALLGIDGGIDLGAERGFGLGDCGLQRSPIDVWTDGITREG